MNFTAALAHGIEQAVGRGASGMTYVAGRKLGLEFAAGARKTDDLEQALDEVRRILHENNCLWGFEPYQRAGQPLVQTDDKGRPCLQLVFRDCMIRQALFCFGHEQKGSLCTMMYGFFSGALEAITGRRSTLAIVHAGENACLKTLTFEN
ncbi:MAG: hypothetical protein D6794_07980 [Deltaproteobacteria bacterium]|nr:MAG: hypothetical protein D6794_07980 [Deltaproteobacteria bacterium]